ncbi:MAG: eukaryotic-like serine/threonine-protein kinase [Thermoleophilaceae bacterium]|nr:eukaryotic-like serine/threonine-protein kinase [Thermoleophilaceae bacterium]
MTRLRLALLVAAALLATTGLPPSAGEASTGQRHFSPFNGAGELKVSYNVRRRSGDCNSESFVDGRRDAWRCFVGNNILDPCFESPVEADVVACVESPWTRSVVRVSSVLDTRSRFQDQRGGPAWALVLRGGKRCVFASGATSAFHGRRLNYFCGRHGPYLFGAPDKSHATWRIRAAKTPQPQSVYWRRIRTAWR